MAHYLPPQIMRFFEPRPMPAVREPIVKRKCKNLHGMAEWVQRFEDTEPPPVTVGVSKKERLAKRRKLHDEKTKVKLERAIDRWDPKGDKAKAKEEALNPPKEEDKEGTDGTEGEPKLEDGDTAMKDEPVVDAVQAAAEAAAASAPDPAVLAVKKEETTTPAKAKTESLYPPPAPKTADAYKTLFIARLNYDVTDDDLKYEFEYYGGIVSSKVVLDEKGKSRGYAFVEFERSKDLKEAYKDADGRKINSRRIVVDVERGRTVKNWRPRKLAGGLGGTRIGSKSQNQTFSGREPPAGSRGRPSGGSSRSSYGGRPSYGGSSNYRRDDRSRGGNDRDRRGSERPRDDRGRDRDRDRDRDRRY
jgi:hypothetical protein